MMPAIFYSALVTVAVQNKIRILNQELTSCLTVLIRYRN